MLTPPGTGTAATGDLTERLQVRMGIETGDAEAGMRNVTNTFEQFGAKSSGALGAVSSTLGMISKAAGLVGISLAPEALIKQLLDTQQVLLNLEKSYYSVSMEATRGGGTMLTWAEKSGNAAKDQYQEIVAWTRETFRKTDKEITTMFDAIAKSGTISMYQVAGGIDEVNASMDKLRELSGVAFGMERLGFSPQQIQSLFHSMAVNLQMDTDAMMGSIARMDIIGHDMNLTWNEQRDIVTNLLQQYSKFGVTVDEIVMELSSLVGRTGDAGTALSNLGMAYDILQNRLQGRATTTPIQWATMARFVTPEEMEKVFLGGLDQQGRQKRLDQITEALKIQGYGAELGFGPQQIESGEAARAVIRRQGGTGRLTAMQEGVFLDIMSRVITEEGKPAAPLFDYAALAALASAAAARQTGMGAITGAHLLAATGVLPAAMGDLPKELDLRAKAGGVDIMADFTKSAEKANVGPLASQQKTAEILEKGATVEGVRITSEEHFWNTLIPLTSQIAENTMGTRQRAVYEWDQLWRRLDPEARAGEARAERERGLQEQTQEVFKGKKVSEWKAWVDFIVNASDVLGVPTSIDELTGQEMLDSLYKLRATRALKAIGLGTKGTPEESGASAKDAFEKIFGETVGPEDVEAIRSRGGKLPGGLPVKEYANILNTMLQTPKFKEGFGLDETTKENINTLQDMIRSGVFNLAAPKGGLQLGGGSSGAGNILQPIPKEEPKKTSALPAGTIEGGTQLTQLGTREKPTNMSVFLNNPTIQFGTETLTALNSHIKNVQAEVDWDRDFYGLNHQG